MSIRRLIIEDVRCFAGRQEFNIRPLTFLVGENSTGKSTVLGCFQTLNRFTRTGEYMNFNVEPYQMGAFTDIVRRSNRQKKDFILGFEFKYGKKGKRIKYFMKLTEKERGSGPIIQEQKIIFPENEITIVGEKQNVEPYDVNDRWEIIDFSEEHGNKKFRVRMTSSLFDTHAFKNLDLARSLLQKNQDKLSPVERKFGECVERLHEFSLNWYTLGYSYSFAPIRSKPQRTYNPLDENISPEGSDVPVVLRNISRTDPKAWNELKERLVEFGQSSGLFTDIHVRRLGKSVGDPFQLQIKVRGPKVNMIDVGYGVNQSLPILARLMTSEKIFGERIIFLMQQPEAHLHPKGQAELSSLMVDFIKRRKHNFIIETHSDYMIDRARIEIMNGKILPEDVSLIYLEPKGNHVEVHNITFDEQANLLGVPPGYREFFLKESDRLLGFDQG